MSAQAESERGAHAARALGWSVRRPGAAVVAPAGLGRLVVPIVAAVLLFGIGLVPRLVGSAVFVTPDEDNWMRRAGNFSRALERGRLTSTYQSGHPGVTTMWVARIAMGPRASRLAGTTQLDGPVTRVPEFLELLARARTGFAVAHAALLVVIATLTWRLLGPGPAALAGLLMALNPFVVAHSQIVHLDALSAGLIATAVLAAGVYWWAGGGIGYLALCGVATGLALLTKAPSLFLGLFVPLVAVASLTSWGKPTPPAPLPEAKGELALEEGGFASWGGRGGRLLRDLLIWGVLALATIFALWPVLWVAPAETVRRGIEYQLSQAGTPHGPGNFFLGRPVADPGPWFYPVAVFMRLTPLDVAGLAGLAVLLPPVVVQRRVLSLIAFVFGFGLFLTLASKKLDRYALPLFPFLAVLAGVGLWTIWRSVLPAAGRFATVAALGLVVAAATIPLASVHPYPLAYYNSLAGGTPTAARTMLVGWGEGLDQAAAYLNAQPNAADARIAVYYPLVLNFQGLVRGTVQRYGDPPPANWVVDYVNAAQRGYTPPEVAGLQPRHVVEINGVVYARIYELSPPRRLGRLGPAVETD